MNRTDLDTALTRLLDKHRAWLEAANRAGETQSYIEEQDEAAWPFRGNGPEGAKARLAEQDAKADLHHADFLAARGAFLDAAATPEPPRPLQPGEWSKLMAVLPGGGVFSPERADEILRECGAGPLPATWPGEAPLTTQEPFVRVGLDAAAQLVDQLDATRASAGLPPLPRVEVARKTDPIPPITVTPPASDIAGELARHIRDNLARLAAEPDLPARLNSPARGTLDMAERLVEAVALLEEQHEHMGERLQAANMLGHRRALALSLRCAELNTSEQARAELAELLRRHQQDTAHQTPIIVPDVPMVPVYSIDELARAIAERITEKLAAEPLLRLLDAARAWADCPHQTAACEELQTFLDAMHACQNIRTGREPADGSAT